jgi:hypothetical protein
MATAAQSPRGISAQEAAVLTRALDVCPVAVISDAQRGLVPKLQVVARCECGCDTVEFVRLDRASIASILADGLGETPSGQAVGLIVFGTADTFTCLEVYSYDEIPARLPTLESIRAYGPGQQ